MVECVSKCMVKPIVDKIVCYSIFNNFQWQEMRYYSYQMAHLRRKTTKGITKVFLSAYKIGFADTIIPNGSKY